MLVRMAGRVDDLHDMSRKIKTIPAGERFIPRWNRVLVWTFDNAVIAPLERDIAARMIGVPMGVPDFRECPPPRLALFRL